MARSRITAPDVLVALGPAVLDDVDALLDRYVVWVQAEVPGYEDIVSGDDLRRAGRQIMVHGIALLTTPPPGVDPELADATELGRVRAAQGLPLESLLSAFRLGGRVLWEGFLAAARSGGTTDADALLDAASAVWQIIDEMTTAVALGYREQEQLLRSRDALERQSVVSSLMDGRGTDPAFERSAARLLGLTTEGAFLCVCVLSLEGSVGAAEQALRRGGIPSYWAVKSGSEHALVSLADHSPADVQQALRSAGMGRAGLSPHFARLAETATAARLADLAARSLPPGATGVVAVDEALPETILASEPELALRLSSAATAGLEHLTRADREVLLETARAFLEANASAKHAAERLYCHRNTVLYRLGRLEALTGRGFETSRDRLLWSLGLLAVEQRPPLGAAHKG